jgi:hypothetical protein
VKEAGGQGEAAAPATVAAPSDSFKLQIPVEVQEAYVQARLDKSLDLDQGGMTMTMSGYTVRVTGADVHGRGRRSPLS